MYYIPVILGSICKGREIAKVNILSLELLSSRACVSTELLDFQYFWPAQKLRFAVDALSAARQFSSHISRADANRDFLLL